jgi:hypothetical protein
MGIRKSRQTERLGVGGWGAIRPSHNDPPCAAPSSVGFPTPSSRSAPRPARERQRALASWLPKLIEAKPSNNSDRTIHNI